MPPPDRPGRPPHDPPAASAGLHVLVGRWRGEGVAEFPTIVRTGYEEELTVEWDAERGLYCYARLARLADGSASHRETGFIARLDDGSIQLWNAQGNGRTEVLRGDASADPDSGEYVIRLASVAFGNDPRMLGSSRWLRVAPDRIRHEMRMATTTAPSPDARPHLTGELVRVGDPD